MSDLSDTARTAAELDAEVKNIYINNADPAGLCDLYEVEAEYDEWRAGIAARVTPSWEQLLEVIEQNAVIPASDAEKVADEILGLMAELAEGKR